MGNMKKAEELWNDLALDSEPTQLDRIEAKLDKLLAKKLRKPRPKPQSQRRKIEYDDKFAAIWLDYPKVAGANKSGAYLQYQKRLKEVHKPLELAVNIHMAVIKYAEFIKATGQYTKLPQTFFGPGEHYLCDWTIPADKTQPAKKEHISATYQQYDPNAPTDEHLAEVDRFK